MVNRLKILGIGLLVALAIVIATTVVRIKKQTASAISRTDNALLAAVAINANLPTETVTINNQTFNVQVASTITEQAQGLSDRGSLAANAGMLFPFNPPSQPDFWMRNMNFPLDMVWIYQNRIVSVSRDAAVPPTNQRNAPTATYNAGTLVDNVLELNAGAAEHFRVGDRVTITSTDRL